MANSAKKGGILSMFWEPDVKPGDKVASETKANPDQSVQTVVSSSSPTMGQIDEGIKNDLLKTLEQNNVDGFDYFEFRTALQNMEKVIPSESDRFKAAYAAVSSFVAANKLVETANFYLQVLQKKQTEFDAYIKKAMDERVVGKSEEAKGYDDSMAEKRSQIDKLNQEIAKLQESKSKVLNESISEKSKIERVSLNFKMTFDEVVRKIQADIQKIQTYLIGGAA